jgi:circadian clock protein KaiC
MNQTTDSDGQVAKQQTGIAGFDSISAGGLPEGRTTLVAGTAGSAKTVLIVQFLVRGIQDFEQNGVMVTFEETPEDITKNFRSFGWDLDKYVAEGKLTFVDASPQPGQDTVDTGSYDFSALLARIENAVNKVGAKRAGIDSVSALFTQFHDQALVRRELFRMAAGLKAMKVTSLITAERLEEYGDIARYGVEEFVADNVIILRNALEEEKRRRTIEILKFRGAAHQKGEYPFTVSTEGIEVLPLSSMELTQKSSNVRVSSGNLDLDVMCGGGFYRDSIVLVSGATGCGKTLTVTTFLDDGCRRGEKTLAFAFEESRDQLARNAAGWGMDFGKWEKAGLLKIICQYPETMGLEDHLLAMKKEIESFRPTRIAVDSLSAMERVSSIKSFREFVIGLTSHIKAQETAGLFTATTASLMGGTSITETHISTITDTIILLRYVELLGEMRRGLTVLKMRGSAHDKSIREYEIDAHGMHLGKAFREVGGILSGSPTRYILTEEERLGGMFDDTQSKLEAAAST